MLLFLALRQPANAGLNLAADDRRTEPEPILPKRRIRKLRRAPETPGGPLHSKMISF